MKEDNDIRWGLAQRFEFIEWRAYWVGKVNRRDLEEQFQISTPQASADFGRYQEAAPGNIEYNATEKSYVATQGFRPTFLKLSPERYLLQLQAMKIDAIRICDTWFDEIPEADVVPTILRGPEHFTLRAIIKTIQMRGSIEINYRSLTSTKVRAICPHALGWDGSRWHVRALAVDRGEYRDYVLGRILSVSSPQACNATPEDDTPWQKTGELKLIAHPDLTTEEKETIERDYKLKDGELSINIRLALAFYFIKRNCLDLRNGEISPQRAQLYLKNFDEIESTLAQANEHSKKLVASRQSKN